MPSKSNSNQNLDTPFKFKNTKLNVPNAPLAEQGVLGLMLQSNEISDKALSLLTEEAFPNINNNHRAIFRIIRRLRAEDKNIDIINVATELQNDNLLDSVGGEKYLYDLSERAFEFTALDDYIKQLNDQLLLRRTLTVCDDVMSDYIENRIPSTELNDYVGNVNNLISNVAAERRISDFEPVSKLTDIFVTKIEQLKNSGTGTITGIDTGYRHLNKLTRGFQKGNLIIVAARPSIGKTTFALNLIRNIIFKDEENGVGFFSLEMPTNDIMMRLVASEGFMLYDKIQRGDISGNKVKFDATISKFKKNKQLYIDDTPGQTVNDIIIKTRKLKNSYPNLKVIVIDYLGLIRTTEKTENRVLEIQKITRELKELARSLEISVICLAQLNRGVEDRDTKIPQLSDLRESGAIEQDADLVLLLSREDYYLDSGQLKRDKAQYIAYYDEIQQLKQKVKSGGQVTAEERNTVNLDPCLLDVIVAKNRNGENGVDTLAFFKGINHISMPDDKLYEKILEMRKTARQ
jgi:replicative DNA helicase